MQTFEIESYLTVDAALLAQEILNMSAVNDELRPLLTMSVPEYWHSIPISDWPVNKPLFHSTIYLCGVFPVDRHYFTFSHTSSLGFIESSYSLMNTKWHHERTIKHKGNGAMVKDIVIYQSKLCILGRLSMPLYKAIFKHRHRRLKLRYL